MQKKCQFSFKNKLVAHVVQSYNSTDMANAQKKSHSVLSGKSNF